MKHIALIAAFDCRRTIGRDGRIPWHIPGEQRRFRELTLGNTVIFGRRTYEEIGAPLPHRESFILSRTKQFHGAHLRTFPDLASALAAAKTPQIFIGGGAGVYAEALPLAEVLYLTEIAGDFQGDTFFPAVPAGQFRQTAAEYHDGTVPYVYRTYCRTAEGRSGPCDELCADGVQSRQTLFVRSRKSIF